MTLRKVIGDLGNTLFKIQVGENELSIPNGLVEITQARYENAKKISGKSLSADYVIVNGRYYVMGESAEHYSTQKPLVGAAKYTPQYYGVALAGLIGRLITSSCEVCCYLAYPPGNVDFTNSLESSVLNDYEVTVQDKTVTIHVSYVYLFAEPVGGTMNVMLTKEGALRQNLAQKGRILAIDIGGGTTDFLGVFANGDLDPSIQDSLREGINGVYDRLRITLEKLHSSQLRASNSGITQDKLREVLRTGILSLKGTDYDHSDVVQMEKTSFLNRFQDGYSKFAYAGAQSDCIVLTGAGWVDLYDDIITVLDFNPANIFPSEEPNSAHFANVRGARNQLTMFEKTGAIKYE